MKQSLIVLVSEVVSFPVISNHGGYHQAAGRGAAIGRDDDVAGEE